MRHIGDDVAVVNDDAFVFGNQVFNIFDAACGIQQNRLMTKSDRNALPIIFWKSLGIFFRAVMRIDNKSLVRQ